MRIPNKFLARFVGTVFGLGLSVSTLVKAATFTVTTTADSGGGSLRDALANAVSGDTVDASGVSGTILLTSGELLITNNLTLVGSGPCLLAIDGNSPIKKNRVIEITNATVTISGLTITNGHDWEGGGILSERSFLTLSNCAISGNRADMLGGGILNEGPLRDASVPPGRLVLLNCLVASNSAGTVAGGIYNWGEPGPATLVVLDSTIRGNSSGDAGAGGIKNDGGPAGLGITAITNSSIVGNTTTGYGGGIQNDGYEGSATLIVVSSTLSGNSANISTSSSVLGGGGGIYNQTTGGATGTVMLINVTLSGNSTGYAGGAIENGMPVGWTGGIVTILNCTVTTNSAPPGTGTAIYNFAGDVRIGSTILNGNSGLNIRSLNGIFTSLGYNLSSDSGGGFLTNATDQINTDPLLGPLQDNGGPTFTHALLNGSPAIDKGMNLSASSTDQRGSPRTFDEPGIPNAPGGDGTDIGAYENFTLHFVSFDKTGDDLRLSFTTKARAVYEIETCDTAGGVWSSVPGTFAGNGGIVETIISNAFAQPSQFFRIHQLQ
jgi:hypothetical protein